MTHSRSCGWKPRLDVLILVLLSKDLMGTRVDTSDSFVPRASCGDDDVCVLSRCSVVIGSFAVTYERVPVIMGANNYPITMTF